MSLLISLGKLFYFGIIDYSVYFFADLLVKRKLSVATSDQERCRIWNTSCGCLVVVGGFVAWSHHTPYLLIFLILLTLVATLPLQFQRNCLIVAFARLRTSLKQWLRTDSSVGPRPLQQLTRPESYCPDGCLRSDNDERKCRQVENNDRIWGGYCPSKPMMHSPSRIAAFCPLPRRPLHKESGSSMLSEHGCGYGENDLSISTSIEEALSSPPRFPNQFTSTPLDSLHHKQRTLVYSRY